MIINPGSLVETQSNMMTKDAKNKSLDGFPEYSLCWIISEINEFLEEEKDSEDFFLELLDVLGLIWINDYMNQVLSDKFLNLLLPATSISNEILTKWHQKTIDAGYPEKDIDSFVKYINNRDLNVTIDVDDVVVDVIESDDKLIDKDQDDSDTLSSPDNKDRLMLSASDIKSNDLLWLDKVVDKLELPVTDPFDYCKNVAEDLKIESVRIIGGSGSGKSTFGRVLREEMASYGRPSILVHLDSFGDTGPAYGEDTWVVDTQQASKYISLVKKHFPNHVIITEGVRSPYGDMFKVYKHDTTVLMLPTRESYCNAVIAKASNFRDRTDFVENWIDLGTKCGASVKVSDSSVYIDGFYGDQEAYDNYEGIMVWLHNDVKSSMNKGGINNPSIQLVVNVHRKGLSSKSGFEANPNYTGFALFSVPIMTPEFIDDIESIGMNPKDFVIYKPVTKPDENKVSLAKKLYATYVINSVS